MEGNKIFSYTQRDYERSRQEGLVQIPALSKGQWTDLNATDPGIVLLDYVHALADMIQFYQDHQALESFLSTAKERKNIFRLAQQLGYEIRSAKGARTTCTMVFNKLYDSTTRIPKHSIITNYVGDIEYLTTEDIHIPSNTESLEIPCVQGSMEYTIYAGTGLTKYRTDVEFPEDQKVILVRSNIDTDTITIYDDLGNLWKRVDSIAFAGANEKAYQVNLNYDGTVTILLFELIFASSEVTPKYGKTSDKIFEITGPATVLPCA